MRRSATAVLMAGVVIAFSLSAHASEWQSGRIEVRCPATWPGPSQRGEKLSYAEAWTGESSFMGPEVDETPADGGIFLDCAYGSQKEASPNHLTIIVPGRTILCHDTKGGLMVRWCDTAPEADGTIGPILTYIAEPVTPSTRLAGFWLGMTVGQASARGDGFECAREGEDHLACRRSTDTMTLALRGDQVVSMKWRITGSDADRQAAYHAFVLRFGTYYDWQPEFHQDIWYTPGQPVELGVERNREVLIFTLGPAVIERR